MNNEFQFKNGFIGKRVFVTGHTGFKGSWLCLLLNKLGAEVHGYALEPPTIPSLFELAGIASFVDSKIGDVRDFGLLTQTIGSVKPEIVIHMAAQPLVRESYLHPVETYATNVMGTVHLLEACKKVKSIKAILNITTDKCYENKEWYWGYRENEPMGGYDPYSNSKACSELVTSSFRNSFFNPLHYAAHGVSVASARAGNVIGGGDWADDRLIPDFMRAITHKNSLKIRNPYATRPWQHVLEPLTGYLMLIEKMLSDGAIYADAFNFGPEDLDVQNVEWIADKICNLWGEGAAYEIDSGVQPHEANYLKLDCSKAKHKLGWHPRWDILTTLKSIVDWYKALENGEDVRRVTENQIESYLG